MATGNGRRRKKTKTVVHGERQQSGEKSDVGTEPVRVESEREQAGLFPSGEGLRRLPEVFERSGPDVGEADAAGGGDSAKGGTGDELQQPAEPAGDTPRGDQPAQPDEPQMEQPPADPGLQLIRLDDPQIADLQSITVAFLQLAQHQFSIFLRGQGVHTLPDGSLALAGHLVHRLRTTGVDGLSFSQTVDPMADIEARMAQLVEGIASQLSRRQDAAIAEPPIVPQAPVPRPAAPMPQSNQQSRYPLGRILAGGLR